jgi:hypothetical protein
MEQGQESNVLDATLRRLDLLGFFEEEKSSRESR